VKVTDDVTVVTHMDGGLRRYRAKVELLFTDRLCLMAVEHRGFRSSCAMNPAKVERYGVFEIALRFLEYFFGVYMGQGRCEVCGFVDEEG
jgi:hypothetical protein